MQQLRQKRPRRKLSVEDYSLLCHRVLERDGWRCQNCGSPKALHVHHLAKRSSLGNDALNNPVTICVTCHHDALRKEIDYCCELGDRVIEQARRRVLQGEQVPTAEKIYSIFETHTDLIKRGKVQTPIEFGHKVFLAESAQGLITQYEVLEGNPGDDQHVEPSLERHKETFGHAPALYGSDRGFFSEQNVKSCKRNGVRWCAFRCVAGRKLPSAKRTRGVLLSKGASRCCSVVAA